MVDDDENVDEGGVGRPALLRVWGWSGERKRVCEEPLPLSNVENDGLGELGTNRVLGGSKSDPEPERGVDGFGAVGFG